MFLKMLKNLFHRPAVRMARVNNVRTQRRSSIRNEGFVSYLTETGGLRARNANTDSYDTRLRRVKLVKNLVIGALGAGGLWVVIESARALTLF